MQSAWVVSRPHAVPAKRKGFSFSLRVSQKHLTEFTREFATLLEAGLPVVRSLDILYEQLPPGLLRDAVGVVKEDVEGGSSLSESLGKHPFVFDKLYVNMVRAGEAGGVLDEIFARLADYREKAQRLQQKILGALLYPAAVIIIAGAILAGIMIFIIPKFEQMFREMQLGELPLMTQALMAIANLCVSFWYVLILLPVLAAFGVKFASKTPRGRLLIDTFKLKLPVFGLIVSKSSVSRFCRTLGTLVQSGVPILEALQIIRNATGNQVLANAFESVHASIKEGDTIAEPLRHAGCFDHLVVNMVHVGEETGQLDKMLIKVADTYDNQVDTLVGALMSLLEPALIVGMGIAVGFIVIGLFLPIIVMMNGLR
ncbi:MAG TPA: type II secretion system F family protein [Planctomycetota bacterium]|nr:type II secretion system F family protein [Planctomycetota bacterium]